MLIGELSKRTGYSHDTIRFYEKKGLIHVNKKDRRDNNYKEYPEDAYQQLLLVKSMKLLGFTLLEIRDLTSAWREDAMCTPLTLHLQEKVDRVDDQIKLLQTIRARLLQSLQQCKPDGCQFNNRVPDCIQ